MAFILGLMTVACNGDIFIDEDVTDEDTPTVVDGDGGKCVFKISTKDLERIDFQYLSWESPYRYYNKRGEEIASDSPASEVAKITFEGLKLHFELLIDGGRLTFRSCGNATGREVKESIRLEYGYAVKFIDITILPGERLQLVDVTYHGDIEVEVDAGVMREAERFENDGPLPQSVEVWPMLQAQSQARGIVNCEVNLFNGDQLRMPVLVYRKDGWVIDSIGIVMPGYDYRMNIPNLLDRVNVEVPAHTAAVIISEVTLSRASAKGTMSFRKPVSGEIVEFEFTCDATFPIGYEVKKHYENL